ncbi:hypothetical protein PF001_g31198 [Phytophthora fragariae]|uniref:Uncharacterized protein n=1 Tax=Phytophthora fragariae TaxID=53985 RepID=A0A6A4AVJ6_9STRA|nr:hypothetical protein PF001_g31198 [Phytophthora fragariae]
MLLDEDLVLGGDMVLGGDLLLGGDLVLGEDLFPGTATVLIMLIEEGLTMAEDIIVKALRWRGRHDCQNKMRGARNGREDNLTRGIEYDLHFAIPRHSDKSRRRPWLKLSTILPETSVLAM